jgi:hypothetical protein
VPSPLPALADAVSATLVEDRYLLGTRLRLRRMTPVAGGPALWKLGQKVRPDPPDPGLLLLTNMYLNAEEHALLSQLPGAELRKVRHVLVHQGRRFGVDVFEGRHAGLVLAEVELSDAGDFVSAPPFAGPEVTGDERYTGGWLAFARAEAIAELLRA